MTVAAPLLECRYSASLSSLVKRLALGFLFDRMSIPSVYNNIVYEKLARFKDERVVEMMGTENFFIMSANRRCI